MQSSNWDLEILDFGLYESGRFTQVSLYIKFRI